MDNCDFVYFVNSQGERVTLSSPENDKYWELIGRSGFTAPDVEIFTNKFASGETRYFGKKKKPRTCKMKMFIRGKSTAERDKMFFDMLHVLMDQDGGREGRLYVKRSDGQMVYLNCVYSSGLDIVEQYKLFHIFVLEFFAADPDFHLDKSVSIVYTNGYDVSHYQKDPWSAGSIYTNAFVSFRMDIYNPCRWNVWPIIRLNQTPLIPETMSSTIVQETINSTIAFESVASRCSNVVLQTDPNKKSIMADKLVSSTTRISLPAPELIDVSLSELYFPLAPGVNTLHFIDWNDETNPVIYGSIDLNITYDGV